MQTNFLNILPEAQIYKFELLQKKERSYAIQAEKIAKKYAIPSERNVRVGCVVVGDKGVFTGANIHRLSFNSTTCAERMAIDSALIGGIEKIEKIIIYSTKSGYNKTGPLAPCGTCRGIIKEAAQYLRQKDVPILMINSEKTIALESSVNQLLPFAESLPLEAPDLSK